MEGDERDQLLVSALLVRALVWLSPASAHLGLCCLLMELCSYLQCKFALYSL